VSKGINDSIYFYVAKDDTKSELEAGVNDADYDVYEYILPIGNPNVLDLETRLNAFLKPYELECDYYNYDSSYIFKNNLLSTDKRKKYLYFKNSFDLLGFKKDTYYYLNNVDKKEFKSDTAINLMADRLIKFSISSNSCFSLKYSNYCNQHDDSKLFSNCNMLHLQVVNVLPYDLIYYQRQCDDLIPIELHNNSIDSFQISARNQDDQGIEKLSNYIMVLDFTCVKTIDYEYKIYNIIYELYLWVASFLKTKI
jgi:hypothetical protein